MKPNVSAGPREENTVGRGVFSKAELLGACNGRGVCSASEVVVCVGSVLVGVEGARERAYDMSYASVSITVSWSAQCECEAGIDATEALSI